MNSQKKIDAGDDLKELDRSVDELQIAFDRLRAFIVFAGAGIGGLIAIAFLLTDHPILFALTGFATVIAVVIGLILLIPHRLG